MYNEQEIYLIIRNQYLNDVPYPDIVDYLNKLGYTTKTGKQFTFANVSFIARKKLQLDNRKNRVVKTKEIEINEIENKENIKEINIHNEPKILELPLFENEQKSNDKVKDKVEHAKFELNLFILNFIERFGCFSFLFFKDKSFIEFIGSRIGDSFPNALFNVKDFLQLVPCDLVAIKSEHYNLSYAKTSNIIQKIISDMNLENFDYKASNNIWYKIFYKNFEDFKKFM